MKHALTAQVRRTKYQVLYPLVISALLVTAPAAGQVLVTGETGGAGGQAVMVSANRLTPNDYGTLTNIWAQYGYGLSDRVDVFAAYGNISVFGGTQHYLSAGSNIGILRRARHGLDVSFFDSASVPLTRRGKASIVLVNFALVASHPVTIGSTAITPYGGFNTLLPIGERARGVFTPIETLHTAIVGVTIPIGTAWSTYAEYNPGPGIRCGGAGILYVRPRQR